MNDEPEPVETNADDESPAATATPVIPAEQLFGPSREIWIDHAGVRYRLRITRRNKLILQK